MPHARRTHDLFWTSISPNRPAQLQTYGDTVNSFGWQIVADVSKRIGLDLRVLTGGVLVVDVHYRSP